MKSQGYNAEARAILRAAGKIPTEKVWEVDPGTGKRRQVSRARAIIERLESVRCMIQIYGARSDDLSPTVLYNRLRTIKRGALSILNALGQSNRELRPGETLEHTPQQIINGLVAAAERLERHRRARGKPIQDVDSRAAAIAARSALRLAITGVEQLSRWAADGEATAAKSKNTDGAGLARSRMTQLRGDPVNGAIDTVIDIWTTLLKRTVKTSTRKGMGDGPLVRFGIACLAPFESDLKAYRPGEPAKFHGNAIRARIRRRHGRSKTKKK